MSEINSRVGAIRDADSKEVRLFGYGVYLGDEVHPVLKFPNPKIKLDDGSVVWGCECWWAGEEETKKIIGSRKVVSVPAPKR